MVDDFVLICILFFPIGKTNERVPPPPSMVADFVQEYIHPKSKEPLPNIIPLCCELEVEKGFEKRRVWGLSG